MPGGRPKHVPTEESREMVRDLAAAGFPQDKICKYVGVSECTLHEHYAEDLKWHEVALAKIAGRTLRHALTAPVNKTTAIIIFILKTRLGWRENDNADLAQKIANYVIDSKASVKNKWESED